MACNLLAHLTWPDVAQQARDTAGEGLLFVVPLGSCEQHGPHLPFNVDTAVAEALTSRLSVGRPGVVLGPALSYGASGEHEGFAGTVSANHEVLAAMLLEIGRSASRWATRILFVSGHGGNLQMLVSATSQLRCEGRDVAWWLCSVPNGDAHAGRSETSLMLALCPCSVRLERAQAGQCEPIEKLMPALRLRGVIGVSPDGVLGDPEGASAKEGRALLAALARKLRRDVTQWAVSDDGLLCDGGCAPGTVANEVRRSLPITHHRQALRGQA